MRQLRQDHTTLQLRQDLLISKTCFSLVKKEKLLHIFHQNPLLAGVSELTLKVQETKIAEFSNSVRLDEVAHNNEPPHLDLHCLPPSL